MRHNWNEICVRTQDVFPLFFTIFFSWKKRPKNYTANQINSYTDDEKNALHFAFDRKECKMCYNVFPASIFLSIKSWEFQLKFYSFSVKKRMKRKKRNIYGNFHRIIAQKIRVTDSFSRCVRIPVSYFLPQTHIHFLCVFAAKNKMTKTNKYICLCFFFRK